MYIGRMGERKLMRKRITLLVSALMVALSMSLGGVAFGAEKHGCQPGSQGFKSSGHECRHK